MERAFQSDVWKPQVWFLLQIVAMSYPEKPSGKDKEHMLNFLSSLATVLPFAGTWSAALTSINMHDLRDRNSLLSRLHANLEPCTLGWSVRQWCQYFDAMRDGHTPKHTRVVVDLLTQL